jgi:hypothetical protein
MQGHSSLLLTICDGEVTFIYVLDASIARITRNRGGYMEIGLSFHSFVISHKTGAVCLPVVQFLNCGNLNK